MRGRRNSSQEAKLHERIKKESGRDAEPRRPDEVAYTRRANTKSQPASSPSSRPCGVILSSMGVSICTCNVWLFLMYIGAWEMWKMPVGVELSWSILRNSHRTSYLLGFVAGRMYNLHARWPSPGSSLPFSL